MNLIIREAKIIDSQSQFHNQIIDLEIRNGAISSIGTNLNVDDDITEIRLPNLHISQGWFDSSVSFGEPGFEDRETISGGIKVAAASGFTDIALQPNTFPIIDNQSQVKFIKSKFDNSAINVHPIGALTKGSEGKDLAELFDMKNSGAVAFGDYNRDIENANLMKIGLQYAKDFSGLIIAFCQDTSLSKNGVANEGIVATGLGLKSISSLSESLQVQRNLSLLDYTSGRLHLPTISCEKSVDLIRDAKIKGMNVTCSVAVHNLIFTDAVLTEFDTNFKVLPPLRTESDRLALITGVLDGTIDMITSDHNPIDIEHKKMEFDYALPGTIGLESAFGALMTILPLEIIIEKFTNGRMIFATPSHKIEKDSTASFTLFNPDSKSEFTKGDILSKSKNSAFLGSQLTGKVYGIINNNQILLNDNAE